MRNDDSALCLCAHEVWGRISRKPIVIDGSVIKDNRQPIRNGVWRIEWSCDWWHQVTLKGQRRDTLEDSSSGVVWAKVPRMATKQEGFLGVVFSDWNYIKIILSKWRLICMCWMLIMIVISYGEVSTRWVIKEQLIMPPALGGSSGAENVY